MIDLLILLKTISKSNQILRHRKKKLNILQKNLDHNNNMQKPYLIPLKKDAVDQYKDLTKKTEEILVFDIDNTLYCESSGLCTFIKEKIYSYAARKNIETDKVKNVCDTYTKTYGLAIKGFLNDFPDTDPDEFNLSVDGCVDLSQYIKKDEKLREILESIKLTKYCLTNASYKHAVAVLQTLDILDCFEAIFYCDYTKDGKFICKPDIESYQIVQDIVGDGTKIHFFEDSELNIEAAVKFGWKCYYITKEMNIINRLSDLMRKDTETKTLDYASKEYKEDEVKVEIAKNVLQKEVIEKTCVQEDLGLDENDKSVN